MPGRRRAATPRIEGGGTWRCATCLAELWDINGEFRDAPGPDTPIHSHADHTN